MQPTLFCDESPAVPTVHPVEKWHAMLRGKAKAFRNSQDDEDAEQEAVLAALISLQTFNPAKSQVQTHMGSAARFRLMTFTNRVVSRGYGGLKGKANAREFVPQTGAFELVDIGSEDADLLANHDEQMMLWNLVSKLPNDQRQVVRLRYICEWNTSTIAWHLGVYKKDVATIEAAAMERLGKELGG